ncbi:flagellar protein FliT [Pseudomonas sp. LS44]|uniref:flagellar protein FliT n=1 Tax=Pseudomonas sp. LS44 TaxID=1357074 RepID=UPI00215A83A0|nr:flagellar protein FliT [Pseudomonas sp. LS44]UVE16381.1 flagellar protein FliT [Pseudomonas sp. LS44]
MQQLEDTQCALLSAVDAEDWGRVAELDVLCRQHVTEAMQAGDVDQQRLRGAFENLLALYASMIERCQQRRDEIGNELVAVNRGNKGAKVYQLFG